MVSARPLIESAPVRPTMTRRGSWRPASAARILPTPSSIGMSWLAVAPYGVGNIVSSMVMAATPAVSSSSTVRLTLSALP